MRPSPVIVDCPIPNRHLQMAFVERNQVVETLPTDAPAQVRQTLVDFLTEDAVPIVDDEPVGMNARQRFSELLQRLFRHGIPMTTKT